MTLNLRPETTAALTALANTRGMSIEKYLEALVKREHSGQHIRPQRLSPDEWASQFQEWADSFPAASPVPDEALSRENLYPDRW